MANKKCAPRVPRNNNTDAGYYRNYRYLLGIAARVFKWYNLPPSLPADELEKRLIKYGWAVVFNHPVYGLVTSDGSIYGVNIYNHANKFNYAQPVLGSGGGSLGVSGVCIYNTTADNDIIDGGKSVMGAQLEWYARMLTDIDVSMTIGVIKSRQTDAVIANTSLASNALDNYYAQLERGELKIPFAPAAMFDNISDLVQRPANAATRISELADTKQQIMRTFYATFGVQAVQKKSERMITDEIDSDVANLAANISDMLQQRRDAVAQINQIFGTNISVGVNHYVID